MCTTKVNCGYVICVVHCASCDRLQDYADHLERSNLVCTFFELTVHHLRDI